MQYALHARDLASWVCTVYRWRYLEHFLCPAHIQDPSCIVTLLNPPVDQSRATDVHLLNANSASLQDKDNDTRYSIA